MPKHNTANERIKREYFSYLKEAKRMSEKSIDQAAAAIAAFEASTGHKDFKRFHIEQAKAFKRKLEEAIGESGKPLAIATIRSRVMAVKAFFQWLPGRQGYRRLGYADADYFNLSARNDRIASTTHGKSVPSIEQIRHVLKLMPHSSDIEKRNRATIAFALLTGARDDAIASFKLKHVDCTARTVDHDAREVRTKFGKTIKSDFFPVGDDVETIVIEWVAYLNETLLFGPNDALFPKTRVIIQENGGFKADGLTRENWTSAQPLRKIFARSFAAAGQPYYNPHTFRSTIARLGESICRTPEEFKAWSQNLGHESPLTTFTSYGAVPSHRQAEILSNLKAGQEAQRLGPFDNETVARVLRQVAMQHSRKSPTTP